MSSSHDELRKLALGTIRLVQEFKKAQELRTEVDRITFEILMMVKNRGRIRPSDIANELHFNPSSITRRIQALKQSGHISVTSDPADLRSSMISISLTGEEELLKFLDKSAYGLERILEQWDEGDIKQFADLLCRYTDTMKDWRLNNL
ncbi:MarR family transcriptional regulator [Paenibacillus sp. ACRRX]|uniref:MarR family winged helix-turn-helix transcriptional regulator n=1 Tax=unclassified Paenibacillus TaxID=185978 RepID=UPI001EF3E9E4|nr:MULTISPECIES: MarR family transcriptional regulator [unclassified Paenibacillus]MCG7407187.1 MarR family transcriptional regulator [Paenibacillus sp. ACRRX]MDK8180407.1 MarR family transcriptional regulator [Paenibacillus sp. UMB4589-SE434]